MADKQKRPRLVLENCDFHDNGIGIFNAGADLEVRNTRMTNNPGGAIISTSPPAQEPVAEKRWYEKPLGIVALMVVGGLIVAGLVYQLGWAT